MGAAQAAAIGLPQGQNRLATFNCIEAASCSALYSVAPGLASKYHLNLVYRAEGSLVQPDFTSTCQAAKSAGAQLFFIFMDPNSIERIARSCASVNYHPQLFVATGDAPPQATDPLLDGMYVSMPVLPWMVTSNPGIAEYRNVMAKYGAGLLPSNSSIVGWVSAKLFQLAAQHLPDAPTSESLLDGLWSIKGNDLGGLTVPLTFSRDQSAPMTFCYWQEQFKNGQIISPNNGQRTCS
jgi:branched-chain amino acid transport system substrate-binding protein